MYDFIYIVFNQQRKIIISWLHSIQRENQFEFNEQTKFGENYVFVRKFARRKWQKSMNMNKV